MGKKADKFICVEECFHNGRLYDPAETSENGRPAIYTRERIGDPVPRHFRRVKDDGTIIEGADEAEKREAEDWKAAKEKKTAERKAYDAAQETEAKPSTEAEDVI